MDGLRRILWKIRDLDLANQIEDVEQVLTSIGGSCEVFRGHCTLLRKKVAIKRIRLLLKKEEKFAQKLTGEIYIWSKLEHPNVLHFIGFYLEESGFPNLVSEWMENGTLLDYMPNISRGSAALNITIGIAEGLSYLHMMGVIHSDLKSSNVLISGKGIPLLTDFGISRILNSSVTIAQTTSHSLRGTPRWMAIELLDPADGVTTFYTTQTDVWAFGMVTYEILARQLPYSHLKSDMQVITAIMKKKLPTRPTYYDDNSISSINEVLWQVCEKCWALDPDARPSIKQTLGILRNVSDPNNLSPSPSRLLPIERQPHESPPLGVRATVNSPDQSQSADTFADVQLSSFVPWSQTFRVIVSPVTATNDISSASTQPSWGTDMASPRRVNSNSALPLTAGAIPLSSANTPPSVPSSRPANSSSVFKRTGWPFHATVPASAPVAGYSVPAAVDSPTNVGAPMWPSSSAAMNVGLNNLTAMHAHEVPMSGSSSLAYPGLQPFSAPPDVPAPPLKRAPGSSSLSDTLSNPLVYGADPNAGPTHPPYTDLVTDTNMINQQQAAGPAGRTRALSRAAFPQGQSKQRSRVASSDEGDSDYEYEGSGGSNNGRKRRASSTSSRSPSSPRSRDNSQERPRARTNGNNDNSFSDSANATRGKEIPLEYREAVDRIFFDFMNKICSNLDATNGKGESIHQTLLAKKRRRLDESPDFRPFKFRIQAFTNGFLEELAGRGYPKEKIARNKVRNYLQTQPYISKFNEDGKILKSKGYRSWNIDAKGVDGGWEFRPFHRKLAGLPPSVAYIGLRWQWEPRIWDPQAARSSTNVQYSSPDLPPWLSWNDGTLQGIPTPDAQSCNVTVEARFLQDGQEETLSQTFHVNVSPVTATNGISFAGTRPPLGTDRE